VRKENMAGSGQDYVWISASEIINQISSKSPLNFLEFCGTKTYLEDQLKLQTLNPHQA